MSTELEYIVSKFCRNFSHLKKEKIAIYGIGPNTKAILDMVSSEYNIVAVMDPVRLGDIVFGLPVMTCQAAHEKGVAVIIIVARSSNVPIIFDRIASECDALKINVYDINGTKLVRNHIDDNPCPDFYRSITRDSLINKIKCADVISFDIFDTLLIRHVLHPSDVFKIVELQAKQCKVINPDVEFFRERIKAERELYLNGQPTIYDIYGSLSSFLGTDLSSKLLELELLEEKSQLFPRDDMVEIFHMARDMGKQVICTSDMYLPSSILRDILSEKKIDENADIIVSCEHGVHKGNGLFNILRQRFSDKKILHIGDNYTADIEGAQRYGIDDTFWIPSVSRMLRDSKIAKITDFSAEFDDSKEITSLICKQFNSPFLFAKTDGRCCINTCYDLGYYFIEPLLSSFMDWLIDLCQSDGIDMLLLGARDGWVLRILLDMWSENHNLPFEYKYVYASRSACTLAGIRNESDVMYASALPFAGSIESMLKLRFLLKEEEILPKKDDEDDREYILRHSKLIMDNSAIYREYYTAYLKSIGVEAADKLAYIDFVSTGTCQLWLEKILNKPMKGYYFMRFPDKYKDNLNIASFLPYADEQHDIVYCLQKNYFLIEHVISAPQPSLYYIDKNSNPFFYTQNDVKCNELQEIHHGICAAFKERRIKTNSLSVNKALADVIASYVSKKNSMINLRYFKDNILYDEFCNRKFDVTTTLK